MFGSVATSTHSIDDYVPIVGDAAVAARDESGGMIEAVTDDEILAAYDLLASSEGVFCEPASAASVAGLISRRAELPTGSVVCTLTGHGLKDPATAVDESVELEPVAPEVDAVRASLGW